MSINDSSSDELHWRETYFIVFPRESRPPLKLVASALTEANRRFKIENPEADEEGLLDSLLVESREDNAAVEVSFEVGEAILEQNLQWATEFKDQLTLDQIQLLMNADARLDVAHFERMRPQEYQETPVEPLGGHSEMVDPFGDEEDEPFEMLDPTCLLTVVETLAMLTDGLTVDPASGEIMS